MHGTFKVSIGLFVRYNGHENGSIAQRGGRGIMRARRCMAPHEAIPRSITRPCARRHCTSHGRQAGIITRLFTYKEYGVFRQL